MNLKSLILSSLLAVAVGTVELAAQTWEQRNDLAAVLTSAMATGTPLSVPIGTGTYGTVLLRKPDGSCGAPEESIIDISPGETGKFRFRMLLRPSGGTMDLEPVDHPFVCDLNSWINFTITNRDDNRLRDTANASLHFNASCDGNPDPPAFFMVNVGAGGCGLNLGWQDQWRINPWALYRRYYSLVHVNGQDHYSSNFWSKLLCRWNELPNDPFDPLSTPYSAGSYPFFIGHRNQNWKDWQGNLHEDHNATELFRAHSVLQFDYRYRNDESSGPKSASNDPANYALTSMADSAYVLPWFDDPEKLRLDSIVFTARTQSYESDECDECLPSGSYAPESGHASRTVQIYFTKHPGQLDSCSYGIAFTRNYSDGVDADENNEALWGDNTNFHTEWMTFENDVEGNVFLLVKPDYSYLSGCPSYPAVAELRLYVVRVRTNELPNEYCDITLPTGGEFGVDELTGAIIYTKDDAVTRIHCLDFCEPITSDYTAKNVIAASAQSFSDEWTYDPEAEGDWVAGGDSPYWFQPTNRFQKGNAGKWRPKGSWTYRSDIKPASMGDGRVYDDAGVFVDADGQDSAFHLFNWVKDPTNPSATEPSWLNASTVTRYAPSGEPVEERNILGIYGAAKLAHDNTVPALVAQNAQYDAVDFESFEEYPVTGSSRATFDYAHAGRTSYKLEGIFSPSLLTLRMNDQIALAGPPPPIPPPQPVDDMRGLLIKFWVKRTYLGEPPPPPFPLPPIPPILPIKVEIKGVNGSGGIVDVLNSPMVFDQPPSGPDSSAETKRIYKVAQTGEWSLYQLIVDDFKAGMTGTTITIKFAKNPSLVMDDVWIDDIRAQPITSQMGCYVYDRDNLRLLTQFDDQHFGLYYQYNGEGKLVRKLRETERGLKTVAETQYHTPLEGERSFEDGLPGPSLGPPDVVYSSFRGADLQGGGMGTTNAGNNFDLLGLRVGPDGVKTTLFGDSTLRLRDMKQRLLSKVDLSRLDQQALGAAAARVPEMERLKMLKELVELEGEREALEEEAKAEASGTAKEELQARLRGIEERKNAILHDKLGLSDEEIRTLYEELRQEREKKEGSEGENAEPATELDNSNDSE